MAKRDSDRVVVDMHVHTAFSDGVHDVKEILLYARVKGLNGIAITDHNTAIGAFKALAEARRLGLLVIPGVEVNCREGHILLYGVREELPQKLKHKPSVYEVVDYGLENSILVSIAHPYGKALFLKYPVVEIAEVLSRVQGIEVLNGRTPMSRNELALRLAQKLGKVYTAGSDAHVVDELGRVRVLVDNPVESYEDFLEYVKRKKIRVIGSTTILGIVRGIAKRKIMILKKRFTG